MSSAATATGERGLLWDIPFRSFAATEELGMSSPWAAITQLPAFAELATSNVASPCQTNIYTSIVT